MSFEGIQHLRVVLEEPNRSYRSCGSWDRVATGVDVIRSVSYRGSSLMAAIERSYRRKRFALCGAPAPP